MTKNNLTLINTFCKVYALHEKYIFINKTGKKRTWAKKHKYSKSKLLSNAVARMDVSNNNFPIFLVSKFVT